jgi:hypothetical protein
VYLCFDCASIIRHGSHDEWNGLVVLGDLRGRAISWRRPIDDSFHCGVVLRESIEPNRLDVWSPGDGVFKRFRMTVHRSTIVNVWPIPAIPNPEALAR